MRVVVRRNVVEGNAQKWPPTFEPLLLFPAWLPSLSHSWYIMERAYIPTKQTNCVYTLEI